MDGTRSRCTTRSSEGSRLPSTDWRHDAFLGHVAGRHGVRRRGSRRLMARASRASRTRCDRQGGHLRRIRLGTRTSVRGVQRLPGASLLTVLIASRRARTGRGPKRIRRRRNPPTGDLVAEARRVWKRRRRGTPRRRAPSRPDVSGSLDSRAILAEAAVQAPSWTALTYGLDRCDDSDTHNARHPSPEPPGSSIRSTRAVRQTGSIGAPDTSSRPTDSSSLRI